MSIEARCQNIIDYNKPIDPRFESIILDRVSRKLERDALTIAAGHSEFKLTLDALTWMADYLSISADALIENQDSDAPASRMKTEAELMDAWVKIYGKKDRNNDNN